MSADEAFDAAYELAARSSCQWLSLIGDVLVNQLGLEDFWKDIRTSGVERKDYKSDVAPYERMHLLPYLFLTAGDYPAPEADDQNWYVRLEITTTATSQADTDAKIVPIIDGLTFDALGYGQESKALDVLSFNDFASGSRAAYMIGPLTQPPLNITLRNTAPSAADVVIVGLGSLIKKIDSFIDDLGDFLLSLVGWHADLVALRTHTIEGKDLWSLAPGTSHAFTIDCNGKSEGHYVVHGTVTATGDPGELVRGQISTKRFIVRFTDLHCIEESSWDRGSGSDEPFVVGAVIGHGGDPDKAIIPWRSQLFEGMDDNTHRALGQEFKVDIPDGWGFFTLPVAVYESDDETSEAREGIMKEFSAPIRKGLPKEKESFIDALIEGMAPMWHCANIKTVAFKRAEIAEVILYEDHSVNRWIDADDEERFDLIEKPNSRKAAGVRDQVAGGAECQGPFMPPPGENRLPFPNPDSTPGAPLYRPGMFPLDDEG